MSDTTSAEASRPRDSGDAQIRSRKPRVFGHTFWMLNSIEMFERLAYFGIRAVVPIYIMQATEPGGLHLTAQHKGWIYAWWAFVQSMLPMVTGGFADRYGYKRVLVFAISLNAIGYLMMAYLPSYAGFFTGILVLAFGTSFFKPSLQGSLAQNLTKANSSVGWGIFYWVVNIGAFAGPVVATPILGKPHSSAGWRNLFLASAAFTAVNLLLLLTFKDVPSGASKTETPWQVFVRTIRNVFDPRLVAWLLIMSCFWLMMYQLWDLHPNFIEDWVDSSMVAAHVPFEAWREYGDRGLVRVPQQILLNLNAAMIILLILPVSWLVRRMRTLSAMLIGMTVATTGILVAGLTGSGWVLLLGVVFFSLGEMLTGPKKNEYLGLIAPPGKKGLYLGYVNIPIGIGVFVGSWLAGQVYGHFGEKATLALQYLAAHPTLAARALRSADWSDSLDRLPGLLAINREHAFDLACQELGQDAESATRTLRAAYRYDGGQITNLALQHLAVDPQYAARVRESLGLAELPVGQVAAMVDQLPLALGINRVTALELAREQARADVATGESIDNSTIVEMLWDRFGADPETLNNLALEYLAQGTDRLASAVARADLTGPTSSLEKALGLGRTRSFAALAAALGADDSALERALPPLGGALATPDDRVFAFLAAQPHVRFQAVGRRDWRLDVSMLRRLIESDADALAAAHRGLEEASLIDRIGNIVRSLYSGRAATDPHVLGEALDVERLAEQHDVIQAALSMKDWTASPEQAAELLRMSSYEARAAAAAEVAASPRSATQMLWETYHPQYKVWLPFAAIGVAATIALAIFGNMARRWQDMNA